MDIFKVMDAFGSDYKTYIPQFHAQNRKSMKTMLSDFAEARAAVAEIYEALQEMTELAEGPTGGVSVSQKMAILAKARAALAKAKS